MAAIATSSNPYLIGGKIVTNNGGWITWVPSDNIYRFDTTNSTITDVADLPYSLTSPHAVKIDDIIYVVDKYSAKGIKFNPSTNKVEAIKSPPLSVVNFLLENNGSIYALCTKFDAEQMDSVSIYNPTTNTWKSNTIKIPSLDHKYGTISNINEIVYLCGGRIKTNFSRPPDDGYFDVFAIADFYRGILSEDKLFAPVLNNPLPDFQLEYDEDFNFNFPELYCIDNNPLKYEIENMPNWLSFNKEKMTLTGHAAVKDIRYSLTLIIKDTEGHIIEDEFNISVSNFNAIISTNSLQIRIFPNPTDKYLHLEKSNHTSNIETVSIINQMGNVVNKSITKESYIDVSDLEKGLYFVKFEWRDRFYITRFVKN